MIKIPVIVLSHEGDRHNEFILQVLPEVPVLGNADPVVIRQHFLSHSIQDQRVFLAKVPHGVFPEPSATSVRVVNGKVLSHINEGLPG